MDGNRKSECSRRLLQKQRAAHEYSNLTDVRYGVQRGILDPSLGGTHIKLISMTTSWERKIQEIEKEILGGGYFM